MFGDIVPWKQWPNVTVHEEENLQRLLNVSPSLPAVEMILMTGFITLSGKKMTALVTLHKYAPCVIVYWSLLPVC